MNTPPTQNSALMSLFATPVLNTQLTNYEALNSALAAGISAAAAQTPGVVKSNVGGWHSAMGYLASQDKAVQALRRQLLDHARALLKATSEPASPVPDELPLEGWANVMHSGHYHSLHSHPNAQWSGVYYVTSNDASDSVHPFSGRLEFIDPRPGASLAHAEHSTLYGRCMINPVAGQLLMFPGWLPHQVHTYFGNSPRITVAFNVLPG